MLRKLILVGMLTVVPAGSSFQAATGLACSFAFFAAHIRLMPFRFQKSAKVIVEVFHFSKTIAKEK